jgi:hypothetical protein
MLQASLLMSAHENQVYFLIPDHFHNLLYRISIADQFFNGEPIPYLLFDKLIQLLFCFLQTVIVILIDSFDTSIKNILSC